MKKKRVAIGDLFVPRASLDSNEYVFAKYRVAFADRAGFDNQLTQMLLETTLGTVLPDGMVYLPDDFSVSDFTNSAGFVTERRLIEGQGIVELAIPLPLAGVEEGTDALLATVLYISTFSFLEQCILIDIELPATFLKKCGGPQFGVEGVRETFGVHDRPLVGLVLKPRAGVDAHFYAELAREALHGGADYVIDDELLCDWPRGAFEDRMVVVGAAVKQAESDLGVKKSYIANVTARPSVARRRIKVVKDNGIDGIHLNSFTMGTGAVRDLSKYAKRPTIVSKIGRGVLTRGSNFGVSPHVLSKLSRISGGDAVYTGSLSGMVNARGDQLVEISSSLRAPLTGTKTSMAISSGRTSPAQIHTTLEQHCSDIMIQFDADVLTVEAGIHAAMQVATAVLETVTRCSSSKEVSDQLWELYQANNIDRSILDHFGWLPPETKGRSK